ncbi:heterokaryon incompatibility protein-domain-containing protein [Xylariaceae sp. FL1651]|nr:heterokaryon incompatibility protein-domain-containing protein [Xylariaceae sp. FL1651]
MWLINTHTFKQEDIVNPEKGSYAILSHTWGDRELSFKQYKDIRNARKTKRLTKVLKTIRMAYDQKLKYAWVDTCCIDKSSSAELSEAINSMFKWYSDAAVCFAYLPDLPSVTQISMSSPEADEEEIQQKQATFFSRCRWFSRGWTLQELVAPNIVEFYDSEWNLYGTKATLAREISNITRIPHIALYGSFSPQKFSVAQRMSWAANRCTTRVEDIAYCLMGLFDINMALLYGEGNKAFARLQEEICKQSADLSLFAWKSEDEISTSSPSQKYRGIFASSPSEFRDSSAIYLISRNLAIYHLTTPPEKT